MKDNSRIALHFVGIAIIAGAVFALITPLQYGFIYSSVIPYTGTSLDVWVDDFVIAAQLGAWITLGLVVLWYILGQWSLKVFSWQNGGKRLLWFILGVASVVASLGIGFLMTERTQAGGEWAWVFYTINPILLYYASTLLFSPTAYKYAAPLATYVRRWG